MNIFRFTTVLPLFLYASTAGAVGYSYHADLTSAGVEGSDSTAFAYFQMIFSVSTVEAWQSCAEGANGAAFGWDSWTLHCPLERIRFERRENDELGWSLGNVEGSVRVKRAGLEIGSSPLEGDAP